MSKLSVWNGIRNLYCKHGNSLYIGENISQLSHAVQTARLAKTCRKPILFPFNDDAKHDASFITAALLHDVGQLVNQHLPHDQWGTFDHEEVGADYLELLNFNEDVVSLVRNHVLAKRFLCSVYPRYYNKLSVASQQTFIQQGGKLSKCEIIDLESDPTFIRSVELRRLDDVAKKGHLIALNDFDSFKPYVTMCLTRCD